MRARRRAARTGICGQSSRASAPPLGQTVRPWATSLRPGMPRPATAASSFQVLGDGPPDLVFMAEGVSHLDLAWDIPAYDRVFRRMASFSRLIRFDTRGSGLSDPIGLRATVARRTGQGNAGRAGRHGGERGVVANSGRGCWGSSSPPPTRPAPPPRARRLLCALAEHPITPGACRRRSSSRPSVAMALPASDCGAGADVHGAQRHEGS